MPSALIEINGKQYFTKLGEEIIVSSLNKKVGEKVKIDKVLLVELEGNTSLGQPYLDGIDIEAEVVKNFKGPKIDVKKFKSKVRYRKKAGFRPHLTTLKILKIGQHHHQPNSERKNVPTKEKTVKKAEKTPKTKNKK